MAINLDGEKFVIVADGSGDATVTASRSIFGFIYKVVWIDGTLADGVDAVLSDTLTPSGIDETILTLTNANDDAVYYPQAAQATAVWNAGAGLTYPMVAGTLSLVVSSGGAAGAGTMIVYWFR